MIENPSTTYGGLAVICELSRFDRDNSRLICGYHAKELFNGELLKSGMSRSNVHIRTPEETSPLPAGTKCVLALGESVIRQLYPGVTLGEQRGAPVVLDYTIETSVTAATYREETYTVGRTNETSSMFGVEPATEGWTETRKRIVQITPKAVHTVGQQSLPTIFSYSPQEACDPRRFERADEDFDDGEDDDAEESVQAIKSHGKTRRKNWRFWLKADIRKAVRIAREGLQADTPKIVVAPDVDFIINLLRTHQGGDMEFDIETEDNLQYTCVGFSFSDIEEVYVLPMCLTHEKYAYYYGDRASEVLHALGCALLCHTVVIHNAKFDLFVNCWRYGLPAPRRVFCTMNSWSRCYIEVEKSLCHVMSFLTDLPYHKNQGHYKPWKQEQAGALYQYNGLDVYALKKLKPAIIKLASEIGALENVELVNRSVIPYMTTELRGIPIDWPAHHKLVTETDARQKKLLHICHTLAGYKINPGSWQQVQKYLYTPEGCGIPLPAKDPTNVKTLWRVLMKQKAAAREEVDRAEKKATKEGRTLTEDERLNAQLKHDVPLIPWLLKYGQEGKIASIKEDGSIGGHLGFKGWEGITVCDKFTVKRFTTQYGFAPVTFRRNSRKIKLFDGSEWGCNGQNWAKELRHLIVAPEGKLFGQIDEDGADARCVAWLAKAGNYRELFLAGIKPHTFIALHLFKDEWKKYFDKPIIDRLCSHSPKTLKSDPDFKAVESFIKATDESEWKGMKYYFLGKKICHAASYGMGARTFRVNVLAETEGTLNLVEAEAKHFLDFFFKLFPEILEWQGDVRKQIDQRRLLRNYFGHPRYFTSFTHGDAYREAYAFSPQSTVGQIIAYAVCELQERVDSGDEVLNDIHYQFVQDGHDAILFMADAPYIGTAIAEVQKHINRTLTNSREETFVMKSGAQIGRNWGMAEKYFPTLNNCYSIT